MSKIDKDIWVRGARMHNLKNITVRFPYNKLIVVTGVSGSGKSSLTIDTLFAEGQRRYVESLSSYARQFMKSLQKPDVDFIDGLCPAIAIEQKVSARTPRSTVGSMTEIIDYLRLLYAKIGITYSPISGERVRYDEVRDVVDFIKQLPKKQKVWLLIPMPATAHSSYRVYLSDLLQKGITRLYHRASKEVQDIQEILEQEMIITVNEYDVLIDRLVIRDFENDDLHRLADSIQTAFDETGGDVYIDTDDGARRHFCNRFERDGMRFEMPTPAFFSSNNPYGACPECEGFGSVLGIDPDLVIPNKNLSVYEGAVACWQGDKMGEWKQAFIRDTKNQFPIHRPVRDLSKAEWNLLWQHRYGIDAFFGMVAENLYKVQYRVLQARYRGRTTCPSCGGSRLRPDALYVKIQGKPISDLLDMPADSLFDWLQGLQLSEHDETVAQRILTELHIRLQTLLDVGLHYLTLSRTANTLSGGESQRIQLTRVIGSNLTDSLYILDEPSIGLHARDTERLIGVLKRLRDLGNTVIVVEHDDQMMRAADHIIDIGPLASHLGGELVAEGNYKTLLKNKKSLTAAYLSGEKQVSEVRPPRPGNNRITLTHCRQHNLKDIEVSFPLNCLCAVSGVSGSGKTTLIKQILYPALCNALGQYDVKPGYFGELLGDVKAIKAVELVDQNPIGKSSRSNPVTYIKAYDEIRQLFAAQHLAQVRGYTPGFFSFNVDGGRCDECKGDGEITVEMQFLADVHLTCESCKGKRFKPEVLDVRYRDKNIAEVLGLSVDEAIDFFAGEKKLVEKLRLLAEVGLGYIQLGQSSDTLSGGEAQRVKLASFLDKSWHGKNILFIFDEPTTGLHFHDIGKLLHAFRALVDQGHSIIVIEHNPDVLRYADWLIDIGPEGGEGGGTLVFAGTPNDCKKTGKGYTAKYL